MNNYGELELEASRLAISQAEQLGLKSVCLFVDEELYGFFVYILERNKKDITAYCIKATHDKSLGYEIVIHLLAKWFSEHGVGRVNLNADYGLLRLRMFMLTFGPMDFYRKYTIEPREGK